MTSEEVRLKCLELSMQGAMAIVQYGKGPMQPAWDVIENARQAADMVLGPPLVTLTDDVLDVGEHSLREEGLEGSAKHLRLVAWHMFRAMAVIAGIKVGVALGAVEGDDVGNPWGDPGPSGA